MALVHQGHLLKILDTIFPYDQKLTGQKTDPEIFDSVTGKRIELDIYIPALNICFEFQDYYHYESTWYVSNSLATILQRDNEKKELVLRKGITFVAVPCWWEGDIESVHKSINFQRPDLLPTLYPFEPVTLNPPFGYFKNQEIPDVGELMLASFPNARITITGDYWWLGEKYDGLRCCWNAKTRFLYTRSGREVTLLPSFVKQIPSVFMDSECWFGRGQFHKITQLVGDVQDIVHWTNLRIASFDVPRHDDIFEERYNLLLDAISPHHAFIIVAMRIECKSTPQVKRLLKKIIEGGGEGGILRKQFSTYVPGRSPSLLKLKASQGDKEALVVRIGKKKSVHLKLPNGKIFIVTEENVPKPRPKVGDIVTFSYENFVRRELPVNPKIIRIRSDVSWQDVISNDRSSLQDFSANTKQPGHWTRKNMRLFLEQFARNRNMDPHLAETWYKISRTEFDQTKGGSTIGHKIGGSFYHIIQKLFPELDLDPTRFVKFNNYHWREIANRKSFFEIYARANGFDPQIAENWYTQPKRLIKSSQGASAVLSYYDFSVIKALSTLFPNIGLVKSKFPYFRHYRDSACNFWEDEKNRRALFENYARSKGFSPLNPAAWYSQPTKKMSYEPAFRQVLRFHSKSVANALAELFPELGLIPARFSHQIGKRKWGKRKL